MHFAMSCSQRARRCILPFQSKVIMPCGLRSEATYGAAQPAITAEGHSMATVSDDQGLEPCISALPCLKLHTAVDLAYRQGKLILSLIHTTSPLYKC